MAGLPLNNFKTITAVVNTVEQIVYTAPLGFKSVFLLAQITNTGSVNEQVTFKYGRNGIETEIVSGFTLPPNDTVNLLTGKLVLETDDYIKVVSTDNNSNSSDLQFIASILETSA